MSCAPAGTPSSLLTNGCLIFPLHIQGICRITGRRKKSQFGIAAHRPRRRTSEKRLFTIEHCLKRFLEDVMKNVNEPHSDMPAELSPDPQVIPMGGVRAKTATEPPLIARRELEDLR